MSYEPEIIISSDKEVLKGISKPETLVTCWDTANDAEYQEMYSLVQEYKRASSDSDLQGILDIVEGYAQSIIDTDIHPVVNEMARFSGYTPLEAWVIDSDEPNGAPATVPHRDYPCIGLFFYFNEEAKLNTSCIPTIYSGEPTDVNLNYENADKAKAVSFPAQSVAIIKLHKTTHFAPESIPAGSMRVVMNARYDY